MKKIVSLVIISSVILFTGMFHVKMYGKSSKKHGKPIICRQIIPPMMEKVKVSKKKLENGVLITMKSKKADRIERLKRIIFACQQEAARLETDKDHESELLYVKGVQCTLTEEPASIKIQLVSDNPGLVKVIKKVYIPSPPFISGFKPGSMGSDSGGSSGER